ncbi:MAG: protein kinase [Steroidobacteraceae bacterium]
MAKKLKVGDTLRGYRVTKVLGPGMMAIAYAAETSSGAKVFLKQYKSPSPTVIWYQEFVNYQRELGARVVGGKASHYAVSLIETFEEVWGGRTYFSCYEFVEHGQDLEQLLENERDIHRRTRAAPARDPAIWARHVTWAKVLMAGVAALHESKIVHADLKPANAYMIQDPSLEAGFQLKLIDMDFSVLADRRAPWHGHQGYVGTDNYRSPEHLTRGAIPGFESDVFTCGLILHELLAGVHPYWNEDQALYAKAVRAFDRPPPGLIGEMPAPASNAEVSGIIHRCLEPDPKARPTAAAVRLSLSGRRPRSGTTSPSAPVTAGSTAVRRAMAPAGAALRSDRLRLVAPNGETLRIGVRTTVGKTMLRSFGADAEFWDDPQCTIERAADGRWNVVPASGTVNETLLNGALLLLPRPLSEGDVLAAGRGAKGISKLPLTVHGD